MKLFSTLQSVHLLLDHRSWQTASLTCGRAKPPIRVAIRGNAAKAMRGRAPPATSPPTTDDGRGGSPRRHRNCAEGAGAARQALLDEDSRDADRRPLRARGAKTAFTAGRARRDPRTDGARNVPALRALAMGRAGKNWGELEDLPPPARWREWMGRVEAVVFASAQPVLRENLAEVVGKACNLDLIIDDIKDEPRGRPYEIVSVAGGWSFRTELGFGAAIRAALGNVPSGPFFASRPRSEKPGKRQGEGCSGRTAARFVILNGRACCRQSSLAP